jgi:hypothetical protein
VYLRKRRLKQHFFLGTFHALPISSGFLASSGQASTSYPTSYLASPSGHPASYLSSPSGHPASYLASPAGHPASYLSSPKPYKFPGGSTGSSVTSSPSPPPHGGSSAAVSPRNPRTNQTPAASHVTDGQPGQQVEKYSIRR